jgi:hypothetical protein
MDVIVERAIDVGDERHVRIVRVERRAGEAADRQADELRIIGAAAALRAQRGQLEVGRERTVIVIDEPRAAAAVLEALHLLASGDVGEGAVRIAEGARDAEAQALGERAADRRAGTRRVEIAIGGDDVPLERVARLLGRDHDRTGGSVAAVEGALWAFQHLDLLDAEQVLVEGLDAGQGDAVDDDRDVGIGVAHRRLAADVDIGFARIVLDEGDVGRRSQKVHGSGDAALRDGRFGDDADRDRYFDQAFIALGRGDDDVRDTIALWRCLLGRCRLC